MRDNNFVGALCSPFIVAEYMLMSILGGKENRGKILECGTYKGYLTIVLNHALRINGIQNELHTADTFSGFPYDGMDGEKYKNGDLAAGDHVISCLESNGVFVHKGTVEDVLPREFKNDSFCFVFLDLDLEKPTRFAWDFVNNKVTKGGIVGFHDYSEECDYSLPGTNKVVDEIKAREWTEIRRRTDGARDNKFIFFRRN